MNEEKKTYFLNVSKNQVRFEFGKSTLRPDDSGECRTTAAQSTFVAKSVVGTDCRVFNLTSSGIRNNVKRIGKLDAKRAGNKKESSLKTIQTRVPVPIDCP